MTPGTVVWINLDPTVGHEQRGHRPALVVSEAQAWGMVFVVPLTSTPPRGRTHHRMSGERMSVALCEQMRAVDTERITKVAGQASPDDLRAVRRILSLMLGV